MTTTSDLPEPGSLEFILTDTLLGEYLLRAVNRAIEGLQIEYAKRLQMNNDERIAYIGGLKGLQALQAIGGD